MFLLLPLLFLVAAIALPLAKRDVVDPPILYPATGTVWYVGQTQTVTWNTTGLPTQQTNPLGQLVLGYLDSNGENLMLNSPLATNITYSVGKVEITVPNVPTRTNYILVLFGDSGNASPEFQIINNASSTSTSPSSATTESESSSSSPGSSSPAQSTPPSTPSPASPNTPGSSGGGSSPTPVNASTESQVAGALPTPTASSSSATATFSSSTIVTVTASATATATAAKSNAAGQKHASSLATFLGVVLTALYFAFS